LKKCSQQASGIDCEAGLGWSLIFQGFLIDQKNPKVLQRYCRLVKQRQERRKNGRERRKSEPIIEKILLNFLRAPIKSAHQPTLRQEMPKKDLEKEKYHGY
jgi:hypothetical protein